MGLKQSQEYEGLYHQANDIAAQLEQECHSAHLLLSFFLIPNKGVDLLRGRSVDEDAILSHLTGQDEETPNAMEAIRQRSEQVAMSCNSPELDSLHILIAICRVSSCLAHVLLKRCGAVPAKLRNQAMSYLTGRVRRRFDSTYDSTMDVVPVGVSQRSGDKSQQGFYGADAVKHANVDLTPETVEKLEQGELDPERFPWLSKFGRNLTALAKSGKIDPLIGRTKELNEIIDVLGKRRANNPCLLGEPGVGKTALVEGLAVQMALNEVPGLSGKTIIEIDVGGLLAGTQLRGSFSEKLKGIKEEVRAGEGRIIIFIDEIHTLVRAGATGESAQDASNELKKALSRGEFPCIGATTIQDYKLYIETDPALVRRFQLIWVEEPSPEDTLKILQGIAPSYALHHQVHFSPESLKSAVRLSARFLHNRRLPAKAIDLLDLAGSRARRANLPSVGHTQIAQVVAQLTAIPEESLLIEDRRRVLDMENILAQRIIGHNDIMSQIAGVIRRNFAGFNGRRPIGSFLFLGQTGIGKTETAKALASFLFHNANAMVRIDMSEYQESASVTRLIGAPPGYVGHDDGGQLTEAVRRKPYQLILLDEIEKAHRDVLLLLLQLLDEGHLTDGKGRKVSFAHCVVVMTSNLGSECFERSGRPSIGFGSPDSSIKDLREQTLDSARRQLPTEFWNRIDEHLVFLPLKRKEVHEIAKLLIEQSSEQLHEEKDIRYMVDDAAIEWLIEQGGFNARLGARPMRSMIQRHLEARLAEAILSEQIVPGDRLKIVLDEDGRFEFRRLRPRARRSTAPKPPAASQVKPLELPPPKPPTRRYRRSQTGLPAFQSGSSKGERPEHPNPPDPEHLLALPIEPDER